MKIIDIALKDLLRSFRSMFAVGMMLVAPLLITALIYVAFGGVGGDRIELPALSVGVVNQDVAPANGPALGDLLVDMLNDQSVTSWLHVTEMADAAAARAAVDRQELGVALIIPAGFSASVFAGAGEAELLLVQDPTLTIGPLVVKNMVGSFLDGVSGARIAIQVVAERRAARGASLDAAAMQALATDFQAWFTGFQRTLYHGAEAALVMRAPAAGTPESGPQENLMQRIMATIMAAQIIFFAFYTGAYAMMSILREDEEGTLARLFTTPTDRTAILAGKLLAVVLTVLVQSSVLLLIGRLVFGIRWGLPLSVGMAVAGHVLAASGLGVLLMSLVKNTRQAGPVLGGGLTALGMLGGLFTVAVPNMPRAFELMALFTPHGWVLRAWRLAMSAGTPTEMLLPTLILLGLGAAMFSTGAVLFRRRYA
jgi:ABC-2 type transport system permease protein